MYVCMYTCVMARPCKQLGMTQLGALQIVICSTRYVCMCVCMYLCICMYIYVYMYVCMYVCMHVYGTPMQPARDDTVGCIANLDLLNKVCMYLCMYIIYMYTCVSTRYVCIYACIYVYICMYTCAWYTHANSSG